MEEPRPKIFISYSHDSDAHKDRVLNLSNRLKEAGFDSAIDQYLEGPPENGWPFWMEDQIESADFVLIACTETYLRRYRKQEIPDVGKGSAWEASLIAATLYKNQGRNTKFFPIIFDEEDLKHIPLILTLTNYYLLNADYQKLKDLLTGTPAKKKTDSDKTKTNIFNVPVRRNPFFTGREEILEKIKAELESGHEAAVTQVIAGLGGIGKTHIVAEFAFRQRDIYQAVLWADAETSISLGKSVAEIAEKLNLPEKDSQEQAVVFKAVQDWLTTNSNWLLILDNIEDFDLYENFVPAGIRGHVLITTRQKTRKQIAKIQVDEMEEEGTLLLLRRSGILGLNDASDKVSKEVKTTAEKINAVFDGLPVALEMAGAYIEESGTTLEKYLELFESHGESFLNEIVEGGSYRKSVAEAFKLSLEKTIEQNPTTGELIHLCAFLDPDSIPEIIFKKGKEHLSESFNKALGNDIKWNQTVTDACRYSLLRKNENGESLSMHRLVQQVIRDNLNNPKEWAEIAVNVLNEVFPSPGDFNNWSLCRELLPNIQTLFSWIKQWDLKTGETGRLCNDAAFCLHQTGEYGEVEKFYQRSLLAFKNSFGEQHPDVATSLNNLAGLYESQGRYEDAEPLYKDALKMRKKLLGEQHPSVATSLNNLAGLYESQGRYEDAEPLYKDALKMRKKLLGEQHPSVATSLNNLGSLYANKGDYKQSEEYLAKALELIIRLLGTEHPHAITVKKNLEWVREQMKK